MTQVFTRPAPGQPCSWIDHDCLDKTISYTFTEINGNDGDGIIAWEVVGTNDLTGEVVSTQTIELPEETNGIHFSGQPTITNGVITFPTVNDADESPATPVTLDVSDDECSEFSTPANNKCDVNLLGCENGNKVNVPLEDVLSTNYVCGTWNSLTRRFMTITSVNQLVASNNQSFIITFVDPESGAAGTAIATVEEAQANDVETVKNGGVGENFINFVLPAFAPNPFKLRVKWVVTKPPQLNFGECKSTPELFQPKFYDVDTSLGVAACVQVIEGNWDVYTFPDGGTFSETSAGVFCTDANDTDGEPSMAGIGIIPGDEVGGSHEVVIDRIPGDDVGLQFGVQYYEPVRVELDCQGNFVSATDYYGRNVAESNINY